MPTPAPPPIQNTLAPSQASTLTRALQHFTAPEVLDGDNRYRCPKNNKLVRARKRITIEEAPNVLAVHLKRFDFFGRGELVGGAPRLAGALGRPGSPLAGFSPSRQHAVGARPLCVGGHSAAMLTPKPRKNQPPAPPFAP